MRGPLEKAREELKKAQAETNPTKIVQHAAQCVRNFVEAGHKPDASEQAELNAAFDLMGSAFSGTLDDASLRKFIKQTIDKAIPTFTKVTYQRYSLKRTVSNDEMSEMCTKLGCLMHMVATAIAQIASNEAPAPGAKPTEEAAQAEEDAAEAYAEAARWYRRATYYEGTSEHEHMEKKLEYMVAAKLSLASERCFSTAYNLWWGTVGGGQRHADHVDRTDSETTHQHNLAAADQKAADAIQ